VDPAAEAAIRAGNAVFAADDRRVPQNAVGDELRVFDKIGSVADDARHQHLARWQLRLLLHEPLTVGRSPWTPHGAFVPDGNELRGSPPDDPA
jgi:hypothetical protein